MENIFNWITFFQIYLSFTHDLIDLRIWHNHDNKSIHQRTKHLVREYLKPFKYIYFYLMSRLKCKWNTAAWRNALSVEGKTFWRSMNFTIEICKSLVIRLRQRMSFSFKYYGYRTHQSAVIIINLWPRTPCLYQRPGITAM